MILQLIMTHKDALPVVERHLPIWKQVSNNIIFTSPKDSMMGIENEIGIGKAEHHGELSARRIIEIFDFALSKEWDHLILLEYDALVIELPEDVLPEPGGVSCTVYPQNKPHKFVGKFYTHYPMLWTREGMEKVAKMLPKVVNCEDRYYSDRFIGRAIEYAKIPLKNLLNINRSYTKNTFREKHEVPLRRYTRNGAVFFHGVKTPEILKIIQENRRK